MTSTSAVRSSQARASSEAVGAYAEALQQQTHFLPGFFQSLAMDCYLKLRQFFRRTNLVTAQAIKDAVERIPVLPRDIHFTQ